jgi:hypothetical protein
MTCQPSQPQACTPPINPNPAVFGVAPGTILSQVGNSEVGGHIISECTPLPPEYLQKVYFGEFVEDPEADNVIDLSTKFNQNVDILNEALEAVSLLVVRMKSLVDRGLVDGYVNGGVSVKLVRTTTP